MALDIHSAPSRVPARLDGRPVSKRIALVALATDHTSERDFARICDPDQIGVYVNRIEFENPTTKETLLKTGPRLTEAAAQILPGEEVDVVAYGCTAASIVLGNDAVGRYLNAAKPDTPCVTPSSAAFDAFAALGAKRVSLLTPYSPEVTDEMAQYFAAHGPEVASAACFGLTDDREMARISEDSIIEAAVAACDSQADALFLSCTALRAATCVQRIEDRLGKPVVSSNQAMIWRCLRLAGITDPVQGYGRLFEI
ncbi:ectoine utilization protein EutA [Phaeobacter inhibens]|uniref:ectoine utilization protein EutA n=1 Tax=Phaeobacter inhibens TaxID=221822 RepID=UPI0021A45727|nr:ectoine utilization protein EutA [Phaeobacter inhibens]UWR78375.1 ectoine utilization protein EutA [Phaeobacter inhibens]UWR90449.1 ectoine utilization protein EutA [Phaeobacter inhibens]